MENQNSEPNTAITDDEFIAALETMARYIAQELPKVEPGTRSANALNVLSGAIQLNSLHNLAEETGILGAAMLAAMGVANAMNQQVSENTEARLKQAQSPIIYAQLKADFNIDFKESNTIQRGPLTLPGLPPGGVIH